MSLPEDITQASAQVMNDILSGDQQAIKELFNFQVSCNQRLVDHPDLIVRETPTENGPEYSVTVLGVINAILNKIGQRRLAAVLDENDDLLSFKPYRGSDQS